MRVCALTCRVRLTALLLLLLCAPSAAAGEWVRIETPHFVVFGDAPEDRVRDVAEQFERFREALGRVMPSAARPPAVPTIVVVFDSMRAFEPYKPRFNGKPIQVGGFFVSTDTQNLVALAIEDRERALRTIFHEYVHLVVANQARYLPAWLSEGIAEHYSTFQVWDGGRTAIVGRPVDEHLFLLNRERLIPHSELLAVDTASPLYNEGERRSVFYAQSWALVHMMMLGKPDRTGDLARYMALTESGLDANTAWSRIFGKGDVNADLQKYLARGTLRYYRFKFDQEIPEVSSAVSRPPDADVHAILADLLQHIQLRDEAAARLATAAGLQPASTRAQALLARIRLDDGDREAAERLVAAAAEGKHDWLAQYDAAVVIDRLFDGLSESDAAGLAKTGQDALAAVLSARPGLPHALALRARIGALTRSNLDEALRDIRQARALAPGREDYAFIEAHVLLQRRDFAAARRVIGPLLTVRYHTEVRDRARRFMSDIVRLESVTAEASRHAERLRNGTTPYEAFDGGRTTAVQPVFRQLREGEERTRGLLEGVECSARGISIGVRVGESLNHFTAPRLTAIEFITYRQDLSDRITCGPRSPADPVFVTWRDVKGHRIAIAVEFLPHQQ